jgi:hypothetical protein
VLAFTVLRGTGLVWRLGDVGLAKVLQSSRRARTAAGTPFYTAPEVPTPPYDVRVDVFSTGIMAAELVVRYMDIAGVARVNAPQYNLPEHRAALVEDACARLDRVCPALSVVVRDCCAMQPRHRMTSDAALRALNAIVGGSGSSGSGSGDAGLRMVGRVRAVADSGAVLNAVTALTYGRHAAEQAHTAMIRLRRVLDTRAIREIVSRDLDWKSSTIRNFRAALAGSHALNTISKHRDRMVLKAEACKCVCAAVAVITSGVSLHWSLCGFRRAGAVVAEVALRERRVREAEEARLPTIRAFLRPVEGANGLALLAAEHSDALLRELDQDLRDLDECACC